MNLSKQQILQKIYSINLLLDKAPCYNHGLLGGTLGLIFYCYTAGSILKDSPLQEKGMALLEKVFDDLNTEGGLTGAAYSEGGAGLGYVVNYLQTNDFIDFDIDIEFAELDTYLFDEAIKLFDNNNIDYLHGAVGIFYYFASRKQTPQVNQYVNVLAELFFDKAIFTNDGARFCNVGLERLTTDHVDFGLAHGLCGYCLILLYALPHLKNKEKAIKIIEGGVAFILKYEIPINPANQEFSHFPNEALLSTDKASYYNRLAWCYGDLNQVLLLYRAAKVLRNTEYKQMADRIGFQSLTRKKATETMAADSHFCHGSAGLAMLYKSLYEEAAHKDYFEAYEHWINVTANFIDGEMEEGRYKQNEAGLLEGWIGVALVLADYLAGEKTNWAKAFLL